MLNKLLANFYEKGIDKLIEEINLFKNEDNLWQTYGTVNNSAGNLALHLTGGLNYLIGTTLGNTGYVRNRNNEFTQKDIPKSELIAQLEILKTTINKILNNLTLKQMEEEYPIFFDQPGATVQYVMIQLLSHLNYHLGQINYLRRVLE